MLLLLPRKSQRQRRRRETPPAGSEVQKRIELLGPSELLRLKIDKLHALLVNTDPQASIPKPNKKIWQEKANLLPTVQADIRRHLAVAAVQAAPLLQILKAPLICEGESILNMQIEGLPAFLCLFFTRYFRMRQMLRRMMKYLPRTRKVAPICTM